MVFSAGMDVMAQLKNDDSICVKVTWSKMQEDMQNADHRYEVVYSPEGGIENREQASGSECLLKNLKPDTIYTITVGILNKPIRSRSIKITTKQHCTLWLLMLSKGYLACTSNICHNYDMECSMRLYHCEFIYIACNSNVYLLQIVNAIGFIFAVLQSMPFLYVKI